MSHPAWRVLTCTSLLRVITNGIPICLQHVLVHQLYGDPGYDGLGVLHVEMCDQELPLHFRHK